MADASDRRQAVGSRIDERVVDWGLLRRALGDRVDGEVRFDAGSVAAYSTDASNYRQVPIGVVIPRSVEAGVEAINVCREYDVPVVSRGGGTSLAGQATNVAVMIDWAKYCHRLISVDADARTCVVEPGIVLDVLNEQLREYGLRYGPKPATHPNCTLGGMIGNNSCGATAQRTGKVVDNIARLEVLLYDGTRFWCGETSDEEYVDIERHGDRRAAIYRRLRALRDDYTDQIRKRYPHIPRRVSGYNLDSLLPEYGFDIAGLLVGSESTLVTVLRAELELLPLIEHRSLVVLGYDTIADAADAVPNIVSHDPIALEGFGDRLVKDEQMQHLNPDALAQLPDGAGYLMVQFGGDTAEVADQAAHILVKRWAGPMTTRTWCSWTPPSTRTSCGRPAGQGSAPPLTSPVTRRPGPVGKTQRSTRRGWGTICGSWRPCSRNSGMPMTRHPASTGTSVRVACIPASRLT